jgi:hypothetical protein
VNARAALLLPVLAALIVAAALVAALVLRDDGRPAQPVTPAIEDSRTRLKPESNVCQSILHRPDVTAERSFPALYTKISQEQGIYIVADGKVSDAAIDAAHRTVARMFQNNDRIAALVAQGAYIVIADIAQNILDLPEFGCLNGSANGNQVGHACGVADRADYPVVTVNELDLTGKPNGPCGGLNILFHELGHLVQGWTMDPPDYIEVKIAYQSALDAGKYRTAYARTNPNEYFAEATQAFFLSVDPGGKDDRAWLRAYDADVYAILTRVYNEQ